MNKQAWLVITLILLSFAALGCGAAKETASNIIVENYGYVNIDIAWPENTPVGASLTPDRVVKVAITAQAAGRDPVMTEISYPQKTATLEVAYGVSYDYYAAAKNLADKVLYVAETKGVVVTETETPPISFFFHAVSSGESSGL